MKIDPPWGDFNPIYLFNDITFISSEEDKRKIELQCMAHRHIPFIDWDAGRECWVFHTVHTPDGLKSVKPALAQQFEPPHLSPAQREKALEGKLIARLKDAGENVWSQVGCAAGIIDVLTDDTIYEIKEPLRRDSFFRVVGQVLIYRQALNPSLRAVIVYQTGLTNLARYARDLGIEVMQWKD